MLPITVAFIWGMAFSAQAVCSEHISVHFTIFGRSVISAIAMIPVLVIHLYKDRSDRSLSEKTQPVLGACRRTEFESNEADHGFTSTSTSHEEKDSAKCQANHSTRDLIVGAAVCGFWLYIGMLFQQAGIAGGVDTGKAGFLTSLYVVLVPLFGMALGIKAGFKIWVSVALAVCGLYFLSLSGVVVPATEDLLILGCAAPFAIYILAVDHYTKKCDTTQLATFQLVASAVFSLPMFIADVVVFTGPASVEDILATIPALLYLGVVSGAIGFSLEAVAQKGANPTLVTLLMSLESVFAALGGAVLLGQFMTERELFGCTLMFAAVILSQLPTSLIKKPFGRSCDKCSKSAE